jgi:hypothetical protein
MAEFMSFDPHEDSMAPLTQAKLAALETGTQCFGVLIESLRKSISNGDHVPETVLLALEKIDGIRERVGFTPLQIPWPKDGAINVAW